MVSGVVEILVGSHKHVMGPRYSALPILTFGSSSAEPGSKHSVFPASVKSCASLKKKKKRAVLKRF
jgi:hypothetical protein